MKAKKAVATAFCFCSMFFVFLAAAIAANAADTNSIPARFFVTTASLRPTPETRLAQLQSPALSAGTNSDSPDNFVMCNHYELRFNLTECQARAKEEKAGQLMRPEETAAVTIGSYCMPVTQGPVPLNMDPMETDQQKELDIERYRRVELIGKGRGIFWSEAEGFGCHVTRVSPDAALFLHASKDGVGFKFSSSFKYFPFH